MPFDNTPTEITVDTPASLVIEAGIRLIVKPKRWCREEYVTYLPCGDRAYCALGAVRAASRGVRSDEFNQAADALHTAAKRHSYRGITDLNDDARTTHAMVLEVMREAAEIARGKL